MAAACLPCAPALAATYSDPNFHDDTLVGGLTIPTTAAWAPDGRMLIAEKSGLLKVLEPGQTEAATILDITDEVNDAYDRGLLGLAIDTDYETNHYVYLLYTAEKHPLMADTDLPTFSRLERIQVDGAGVVSDRTTLLGADGLVEGQPGTDCVGENFVTPWTAANDLDCMPSEGRSHSIGTVVSAGDGTLYVGEGDSSSYAEFDPLAFRVYDQQSMAGKILHVDRNGHGLPGHPFCAGDNDLTHVCTKIHSLAFRNPFRFKWRDDGTQNGALSVGDVGWNTREEVDLIHTPGHTYGWPCYEGTMHTVTYQDDPKCDAEYAKEGTPNAHVPPDYDYLHSATNAIVGGPVYPGGPYPDSYDGQLFFGDYSDSFLKLLPLDSNGAVAGSPTVLSDDWMGVDLVLAPDGNVAYPDFGTGEPGTGSIKEIVYAPNAGTPHAAASADPVAGGKPLDVTFSAAESSDPDGQALTYTWNFGDGGMGTGVSPTHQYTTKGLKHAVVTVEDPDGHTASAGIDVNVFDSPPTPSIDSPADESGYRDGQTISLHGSATDAQDGTLGASALSWTVIIHHGAHTHFVGTFTGTANPSFTAQRDHDTNSFYEVRLRATDSQGEWRQTTIELRPEGVPFQILSSPSGAPVSYSGTEQTTPFSANSAIGLRTSISAAARFTQAGTNYWFDSWDDDGARLHQVEIPDHASTVTARYLEDKAFAQPAQASSFQDDDPAFAPSHATDDDPSTRWSSKGQGLDPNPWWEVDLGSLRSVSALEVVWEDAYASQYDVLTSVDHVHWSLAASESIPGAINQRTSFPVRKARYVRVQVQSHGTAFGASFFEARALGPPDSDPVPADKAAGRPAAASTTQATPAFDPGRAVDDDSSTRWSSASADGQWWQVDLGSLRTVDTVELNWEAAYASSYRIETSGDGVHFAPATTVTILAPGLRRTTFAARPARFVRVTALARATPFGISFWDARVFGGADPGPDGAAPDTTMDGGPTGPTNVATETFGFSANEPGSWFECRIDGGAWGECSAPHIAGPLADGAHTFEARATDPAGNTDPTPASRTFTVDTAAPDTKIDAGPSGATGDATPTFDFSANEPSTFACRIDGGGWGACSPPYTTGSLALGAHTFDVRATDPAGNVDPTPATRSWTVQPATPPARRYADVITGTPRLLGFWTLGDSGRGAADSKGGHGGRYVGRPARADPLVQAVSDGARRFDGGNDRVKLPPGAVGHPRAVTVELWLERAAGGGRRRALLVADARTPLKDGFTLFLDPRHRPVFALGGTRGRHASLSGPALKADRVYHLAVSYAGKTLTLYVNGARRGTRRYAGGIAYARGRTFELGGPVGRRTGGLGAYAGVLDEVAVYGARLTAAQALDHFRLGSGAG